MKIAIVADAHLHDLHGGYGLLEEGEGGLALRTLEDTMASTRVFNESHAAFLAALDDIVRRGIRDVVLLGDYSDDGQPGAVAAVKRILSAYEDRHGLRFFATFGNHDCFGPGPRHQAKRLTGADGLNPVLVTSEAGTSEPALMRPGMLGMSTPEAFEAMAPYGIERPHDVLLWETPFGGRGGPGDRRPAGSDLAGLDASYVVEPQDGLWLLILDANVFERAGDGWQVRSNAAWDHVIDRRPYLLAWIETVAARAQVAGKVLLAFSHYPVLPLAMTGEGVDAVAACTPDWLKRMPSPESGRKLANAGIRWHFSGHMHVAGRIALEGLTNIAVPSPVAFPGGYMVAEVEDGQVDVEQVALTDAPGFDIAFSAYRAQATDHVHDHVAAALQAQTYDRFLQAHWRHLVQRKHLPGDWSEAMRANLDRNIAQVLRDSGLSDDDVGEGGPTTRPATASLPFSTMVEDYYLLRTTGLRGLAGLAEERARAYRKIAAAIRSRADRPLSGPCADFLHLFVAMVEACPARAGSC